MWYKTARVFAVLALTFFILFILGGIFYLSAFLPQTMGTPINPNTSAPSSSLDFGLITSIFSMLGMVITMIGTASTVLIGWRAERRQSEEFKLRIKQLELQLLAAQQTQPKATTEQT
jgi:hypothetical protein